MKPIIFPQKPKPVQAPNVLIATPCHDNRMNVSYAVSVFNTLTVRKFGMRLFVPGQSGISKARNHCSWHFLNEYPEGTHLMFVDQDIQFAPDDIMQLLKRDVPVIGGLYAHKTTEALRWCLNIKRPDGVSDGEFVQPVKEGKLAGCMPVATVGTGFMLVKREVFTTLIEKFGEEIAYIEDQESDGSATPKGTKSYAFFQEKLVNGRYMTEDWFFCNLCERAGIPMYADCTVQVMHEGMTTFPLKPFLEKAKQEALA